MMSVNEQENIEERERLKALHAYHILDTPAEIGFDNLTKLASLICQTQAAGIIFIDDKRAWLKSVIGADLVDVPRSESFAYKVMLANKMVQIEDTLLDEQVLKTICIGEGNIRFCAGVPIIDDEGHALGAFCVYDLKPHSLSNNQKESLETLAKEVAIHLSVKKKNLKLQEHYSRLEQFESIFNVSPEIHCIMDFDCNILFINDAVKDFFGYAAEEVIGQNVWQFCYHEDVGKAISFIEEGLSNGIKQFNLDFRLVTKDGSLKWISWNSITKNNRWYTYGRDVTEHKKIEGELTKLSFVASKINSGVIIYDSENKVNWTNQAYEKITGFTFKDIEGKRLGDLICGPKTDKNLIDKARSLTQNKQSFTIDLFAYKKDKTPIWLSIYNTAILNDAGEIDLGVEIIVDITEKKEVEEQLQILSLVAKKTNTGVSITNSVGEVTWVNEALEQLIGYSFNELSGKVMGDFISSPETDYSIIKEVRNKAKNKESFVFEVQAKKKDGSPIWLSVANTPILNAQGEIERQIELISDITYRKQVEQEILLAKEQAIQLSEAKEMFLSVMSHEIRTPLNAIIGMTYLLLDNDPKPSQIEDLNILKFSSENLLNLISDILDFTKIETGNLQLESIQFSLVSLIHDIATSLQVSAQKKGNRLNLLFGKGIPPEIVGDKTRLYQIIVNLLGNAIKFTENGNIDLIVKLESETEEQVVIHFEIKDNGIGIPKDKQTYIFETFAQAKTDISRKYGGTGLGLAITKKLLQLLHSEIIVESEEGKGSTFSFSIPYNKFPNADFSQVKSNQDSSFIGKSILLVDDNEINTLIANRIFTKWGLIMDFASDGLQAIDKITSNKYDLVFMDIKMPGIDGFETTSIIRDIPGDYYKNLPIIALTASTLSRESARFKESGINAHLLKPFNPDEVKKVLYMYLD